jgi:arylsulfatase A
LISRKLDSEDQIDSFEMTQSMKRLLISLTAMLCMASHAKAGKPLPNVVVIFADDLGYGDLSCYGATKLKTPNIDRLASEGRRFTDAHSASAVCTPSRYALITGRYPFRRGLSKPVFFKTGLVVDQDRTTIADVMQNAGYATACIGKWHLGFGAKTPDWNGDLKPGPLELGFDYYFGVPTVNSHPPFVYVENHRVVGLVTNDPFVYGKQAKTRQIHEKMNTRQIGGADAAHALYDDYAVGTHLAEKSVAWIEENKEKPFFLYLSTTNIHHPFTPAKRFQGTSECGLYGDFVHELDWIVGEVMTTLEKNGLAENTLVIFTSDNGGMINETGQKAIKLGHRLNGDLLGFKFNAWEGGHRVPFIARWPGKIPAGTVSDQLISNIDLMAAMAAITKQSLNPNEGPDSGDILPALTGNPEKPIREELLLAAMKGSHLELRQKNWAYIGAQGGGGFGSPKVGSHGFGGPAALKFAGQNNSDIVDGKLKKGAPPAQLYDLSNDRSQTTNVIQENPGRAAAMQARLQEIQESKGSQFTKTTKITQPNIILIFTDDQGYEDLGCFGSKTIKTPNLDQMAAEGLKLTNFYAQPVCGVSRAALMTGSYPIRLAEPNNIKRLHTVPHPQEITMAEVLKSAGYSTGIIGKWHLVNKEKEKGKGKGFDPNTMPNAQGFDYFYGTPVFNGYTVFVDDVEMRVPLFRNDEIVNPGVESWITSPLITPKKRLATLSKTKRIPSFSTLPTTCRTSR